MMAFGCIASIALWSVLISLLLHSMVPVAIGAVFFASLIVRHGLHSDRTLY